MKIIFIQPDCRSYRVKFFESLGKLYNGITLLHFGINKGFNLSYVNEIITKKSTFLGFHWIHDFKEIISEYDIVIIGFDPHWLNGYLLPILSNKTVILWGHGIGEGLLRKSISKYLFNKANALVLYHEYFKEILVQKSFKSDKIYVANNTIHIGNIENLSTYPKRYYLYVGRLQARKELEEVLYTLGQLKEKGIVKKMVILGDGAIEKKRLRSIVKELDIESLVTFIKGTTDENVLKEVFKNAIAYVSPGHVGLGVLHSFSYGIPVVTYRDKNHAPEFRNIVDNENGLSISSNDLEKALIYPIEEYQKMGDRAFHYYQENAKMDMMVAGFTEAIKYTIK